MIYDKCLLYYDIHFLKKASYLRVRLRDKPKPKPKYKPFKILVVMKATIYNGIENLTKKEIIMARATEKKAVRAELANFVNSLEYAGKQLTAVGSPARNGANACKGTFKTWLQVVSACYPYQTTDGALCIRTKNGYKVRKLAGRGTAGAVVSKSVQNYIDYKTGRVAELVTIVETID